MRLIDKLVFKDLIGPFINGLMMFLLLVFTAGFLFQATDMLVQGIPLLIVLKFVLYALPSIVTQTFPMAMLLAALMAFGRLSADSEIVAVFGAGIGFPRTVRSVIIMGAIVSVVAFIWNEAVVPPATRAMWDLKLEAVQHIAKSDQPLSYNVTGKDDKTIEETVKIAGGYDAHTQTLRYVSITKYSLDPSRHGAQELIIYCDHATRSTREDLDERGLNWTYYDGYFVPIMPDKDTDNKDTSTFKDMVPVTFKTLSAIQIGASTGKSFNQIMNTQSTTDANRLSFGQLRQEIAANKAQGRFLEARGEEVDLYGKISLPLASLIFGVVGAALGLNTNRGGGKTVGFGMAIFIVFLYWVFYHSMFVVGKNGGLPPMLASFLADIVGAGVGLALTLRASR